MTYISPQLENTLIFLRVFDRIEEIVQDQRGDVVQVGVEPFSVVCYNLDELIYYKDTKEGDIYWRTIARTIKKIDKIVVNLDE